MSWALKEDFRSGSCCLTKETTCLCPTSFLYKTELIISVFSPLSRDEQAVINVGVSHPTSPPGNSEDCVASKNLPQHAPLSRSENFTPEGVNGATTWLPCWQGLCHNWVDVAECSTQAEWEEVGSTETLALVQEYVEICEFLQETPFRLSGQFYSLSSFFSKETKI